MIEFSKTFSPHPCDEPWAKVLLNEIKKFANNFEVFINIPKSLLFIAFVYNEQ
jgi:hypothetical protein